MTNKYIPTALAAEVASTIRGIMGRAQLTQGDLAEVTGISQSHMSKLLRALRPMDLDTLDLIAQRFGISASDILLEAEHRASGSNVIHADNRFGKGVFSSPDLTKDFDAPAELDEVADRRNSVRDLDHDDL